MRQTPQKRNTQRRLIDRRIAAFAAASATKPPATGWLRAVRESLGLTAAQLARRLKMSVSTLLEIEERERTGKVTLETLRRVAGAMECDVSYAVVPTKARSLEQIVETRAHKAAARILNRAATSMNLEKQGVDADETRAQIADLARALKGKLSSALWDEP